MLRNKLIILTIAFTFISIMIGVVNNKYLAQKPKVVVVLKGLETQYWEIVKAGVEKGFHDFGVEGKVVAPISETEIDAQEMLLYRVLNENPDLLVVSPIDSDIIPVLEKYVEKNIPVLLLDTDYPFENKTAYIGTNNFQLGKMGGMVLASKLQPGNEVALISGDINHSIAGERIKGAKASLEAAGIIVATKEVDLPNESELVKQVMETILLNYPNIKGVFADTDIRALGALEAIGEYDLKLPVVGVDGINEMIELIEEGIIAGSVAQNPFDMGYKSIESAKKVIDGESLEQNIDTGVDIIIKGNATERLNFQQKLLK
ncbi:hypothetical protein BKP45_06380 [Anaerobacillus alkalidiazotrophicus]|uniref:Periplasmic binding protein domain-containing protein n=1 Tax=Anaerobacillus alkalidiazotrophicus TaxID=472963 RepID=A0A1S2MF00_9BACI|nr:sugar ABC transporter substrate-binding protein [Anaerobacillus alkalidiazotrophicus]OIJ22265.1 hypothetical protein BKP45_06380 [Anaerobacillus alkalidiazotrophicus]